MRESMERLKGMRLRKPERGVRCEEEFFSIFFWAGKGQLRRPSLTFVEKLPDQSVWIRRKPIE